VTSWTQSTFDRDGDTIYYESAGEGAETVVLSHGLGGNHAIWFQQVPRFSELYKVVTWDQRGFGMSTDKLSRTEPRIGASDLVALLDRIGVERAHLIGQSMGGWVVMGAALAAPDRVASLVICDSPAGVYTPRVIELISGPRNAGGGTGLGSHPAIGKRLSETDTPKAFLYQQIGGFRTGPDETDAIMRRVGATRYDIDDVKRLGLPSLCVVGGQDDLIPPAVMHEVASVLGARCIEIDGAGHSPYFERPEAWNAAVLDFLSSL
jgi:3-oxoadipate enol-lactonase